MTLSVLGCVFASFLGANNYVKNTVKAQGISETRYSGTPNKNQIREVTKMVTLTYTSPVSNTNPIESEIKRVFGVYWQEALKIANCESHLNPQAINDNRKWGGIGVDRGIFQINDVFHPGVPDWCAFSYKCNIEYAHRMFVNDGNTFKRWACGNYYKI